MAKKRQSKGLIQVYTDGAYNWETGTGGYGAVIFMRKGGMNKMRKYASTISYVDTTNNRMEIRGILAAIKRIDSGYDIDIYTDSEYCEKIVKKLRKNFRDLPKANKDLWKLVADQLMKHWNGGSYINISWIRGHSGNTFNEMADRLADTGSKRVNKVVCDQKYHEKKAIRELSKKRKTNRR